MSDQSRTVFIGELARRAGMKVTTIRFYERQGVLPEPERTESGYREYPADAVAQVRFIRHAQELGFTLNEIRELLALREAPDRGCDDIHDLAVSKLVLIRTKIRSLKRMETVLSELAASCRAGSPINECPVIEALNH